jgi:antibiotic biosynthesis monooxygenase (ABM) superfamily enzyme
MIIKMVSSGIVLSLLFVALSSSAVVSIDLQRLYEGMQKQKREGRQMSGITTRLFLSTWFFYLLRYSFIVFKMSQIMHVCLPFYLLSCLMCILMKPCSRRITAFSWRFNEVLCVLSILAYSSRPHKSRVNCQPSTLLLWHAILF